MTIPVLQQEYEFFEVPVMPIELLRAAAVLLAANETFPRPMNSELAATKLQRTEVRRGAGRLNL